MVNAELVRQGDAPVATDPPTVRDAEHCQPRQRDARQAGAGGWKAPEETV
jgi:endonuclease YncB( thermonuclease family)